MDERLKPILEITLEGCGNVELVWGDVLKLDIPALVKEKLPGLRPVACANLPYYITSPILTALLEAERTAFRMAFGQGDFDAVPAGPLGIQGNGR